MPGGPPDHTRVLHHQADDAGASKSRPLSDDKLSGEMSLVTCEAFADLRKDRDLNSDKDLVSYMKSVLIIREKLDLIK